MLQASFKKKYKTCLPEGFWAHRSPDSEVKQKKTEGSAEANNNPYGSMDDKSAGCGQTGVGSTTQWALGKKK